MHFKFLTFVCGPAFSGPAFSAPASGMTFVLGILYTNIGKINLLHHIHTHVINLSISQNSSLLSFIICDLRYR